MWIVTWLFIAAFITLQIIAVLRINQHRRRGADFLTMYGWPHQALWAGVSICAAAAGTAEALDGDPWWTAASSVALSLLAALVTWTARRQSRRLVREEQDHADRLLSSNRARRINVPVTERAQLSMAPDGVLQVLYPAVWPSSPISRVLTRRRKPSPRRPGSPPVPGPRSSGPHR